MDLPSAVTGERPPGVLVGIDGSSGSDRAFRAGVTIAKNRGLPLRLVGTFPRPVMTESSYSPLMDEYLDASLSDVQKMLSGYEARAHEAGVHSSTRAIIGDPGGILVDESRSAQVAVVGKRGQNRFAGRFLGSVSAHLVAHSHCPTLVVPEKWENGASAELLAPAQHLAHGDEAADEPLPLMEESKPRQHDRRSFANVPDHLNFDSEIVVGVDVGKTGDTVVRLAGEAARLVNRPLALVSAAPLNAQGSWRPNTVEHNLEIPNLRRPYTDRLQESAQYVTEQFPDVPVRWQFFDGSPAGVMSEASRTAELIVIGTRGHGGFTGLLLGSVSQSVLNRAVCPVLVVPTHKS